MVLVVSGPSGVGKDAVVARLRALRPGLHFVVTATSRCAPLATRCAVASRVLDLRLLIPQVLLGARCGAQACSPSQASGGRVSQLRGCREMRAGERDGVDYHFVSKAQFEQWIAAGELLEHAEVYGQYKGIPRAQVLDALARGADVVLRLDVQGAATVRRLLPRVASVFVVAGSEAELVRRLAARGTESEDALIRRAGTVRQECARASEFDYVVVNEEGGLERAAQRLAAIIDAERCRVRADADGGG